MTTLIVQWQLQTTWRLLFSVGEAVPLLQITLCLTHAFQSALGIKVILQLDAVPAAGLRLSHSHNQPTYVDGAGAG